MTELKPCPFCGGEAEMATEHYYDDKKISYVVCKRCDARGGFFLVSPKYASEAKAIEAWNRRKDSEADG